MAGRLTFAATAGLIVWAAATGFAAAQTNLRSVINDTEGLEILVAERPCRPQVQVEMRAPRAALFSADYEASRRELISVALTLLLAECPAASVRRFSFVGRMNGDIVYAAAATRSARRGDWSRPEFNELSAVR